MSAFLSPLPFSPPSQVRRPHHKCTSSHSPTLTLSTPPSPTHFPPANPQPPATPTLSPPPITRVNGVPEYLAALEEACDQLVVLKIFAPWCRSCRALEPKVARLAREFASEVTFLEMDYEQNKELCYRLGVCTMPTFIFYRGQQGEIDKFSCGPQRAPIIREKILKALENTSQGEKE